MTRRLITVVGARPQFIKAAAVSRAIAALNAHRGRELIEETLVHTGQHYDPEMSQRFFEDLHLDPPAVNLGVGSGSHGEQTGRMMIALERVVADLSPDAVMVYGDTNSTLAGALVAAKCGLPLVHVEAGLRSYNRVMPEEVNRVVTDHLSALLLCPTFTAAASLANEGITRGVHVVGDVMLDVLDWARRDVAKNPLAAAHGLAPKGYALVTLHRAENTDDPDRLAELADGLSAVAEQVVPLLWPVHPRLRERLQSFAPHPRIHLTGAARYHEMVAAEQHACLILTDSGGVQKEAYWLGVPCVTLRSETEWVETLGQGWNRLASGPAEDVVRAANEAMRLPTSTPRPPVLGGPGAADRIAALIGGTEIPRP
jgi:UDP-N-acetylglucosamine 2-epimerase